MGKNRNRKFAVVSSQPVAEEVGSTTEVLESMTEGQALVGVEGLGELDTETAEVMGVGETAEETVIEETTEEAPGGPLPESITEEKEGDNVVHLDPFRDVPAPEADIVDPEPVVPVKAPRRGAVTEDSVVSVHITENPQRTGSKSFGYNNTLLEAAGLTVKQIMELGVPRHHINWALKQGWISGASAPVPAPDAPAAAEPVTEEPVTEEAKTEEVVNA